MRALIAVALLISLSGCGMFDRGVAKWTGYSKICVDNVTYIQFTSGATAQRDKDDKLVPC